MSVALLCCYLTVVLVLSHSNGFVLLHRLDGILLHGNGMYIIHRAGHSSPMDQTEGVASPSLRGSLSLIFHLSWET